jgi:hypothetical protein
MLDAGAQTNGFAIGYDDRILVKPPNDSITSIDYQPGTDPDVSIQVSR